MKICILGTATSKLVKVQKYSFLIPLFLKTFYFLSPGYKQKCLFHLSKFRLRYIFSIDYGKHHVQESSFFPLTVRLRK